MNLRDARIPRPQLASAGDKYLPVWVVFAMTASVLLLSCQLTAGIKDSAQRDAVAAAAAAGAAASAAMARSAASTPAPPASASRPMEPDKAP